jgi:hypothetical protein
MCLHVEISIMIISHVDNCEKVTYDINIHLHEHMIKYQ